MTQKPEGILTSLPKVPSDEIQLPSKGWYYGKAKTLKGKTSITVPYLIGDDQDATLTPAVLESGKFLDAIIETKLSEAGYDPDEILPGDAVAMLVYLRSTALGDIYETVANCVCRKGKTEVRKDWKLSKIKVKKVKKPDENGHLKFTTPQLKHEIIYTYLNRGQLNKIEITAQNREEQLGPEANKTFGDIPKMRLVQQIVSIGGNTDKHFIGDYLKVCPYKDKLKIRTEIVDNEPGLDLSDTVQCHICERTFKVMMALYAEFLWPDVKL